MGWIDREQSYRVAEKNEAFCGSIHHDRGFESRILFLGVYRSVRFVPVTSSSYPSTHLPSARV
jgi:hypothetical protein